MNSSGDKMERIFVIAPHSQARTYLLKTVCSAPNNLEENGSVASLEANRGFTRVGQHARFPGSTVLYYLQNGRCVSLWYEVAPGGKIH